MVSGSCRPARILIFAIMPQWRLQVCAKPYFDKSRIAVAAAQTRFVDAPAFYWPARFTWVVTAKGGPAI